jgi:6-phosphogluconolactonase
MTVPSGHHRVFIGTNTWRDSKGIYTCLFNSVTGKLGEPVLAGECPSPANLILHPSKQFLYAGVGMSASSGGKFHLASPGSSPIIAFAIEGAKLRLLNTIPAGGVLPTHGEVDQTGRNLLLSCYQSGHSEVFRLNSDGSIGQRTAQVWSPGLSEERRPKSHPHITVLSKNQRYAIVAELSTDQCVVYRFDSEKGSLDYHHAAKTPAAAGPRHFAFHPGYEFAYSSNEHDGTVTAYSWNEDTGVLETLQTVTTLPEGFQGKNRVSDIRVHPSGKFVYAANRGHETIAIFAIDTRRGTLTPAGRASTRGQRIWAVTIDPTGKWMILPHVDSDNVVVFEIDQTSGDLKEAVSEIQLSAPSHVVLI